MPYKLAIFDMDGTLSDSFPWFRSVLNSVADRHRFRRVEEHQIEQLRDSSAREIIGILGVAPWRIPFIARDMRRMKARDMASIPLFPGVERMLQTIAARGIMLAIVSSDSEANIRHALGPANAELIAHYACGSSLFAKARKFRRVLKLSGVAPDDALCIGDEIRDIEAAREAGIDFGAVTWGYTSAAALKARAPNYLFSRIDEVIAAVASRA